MLAFLAHFRLFFRLQRLDRVSINPLPEQKNWIPPASRPFRQSGGRIDAYGGWLLNGYIPAIFNRVAAGFILCF